MHKNILDIIKKMLSLKQNKKVYSYKSGVINISPLTNDVAFDDIFDVDVFENEESYMSFIDSFINKKDIGINFYKHNEIPSLFGKDAKYSIEKQKNIFSIPINIIEGQYFKINECIVYEYDLTDKINNPLYLYITGISITEFETGDTGLYTCLGGFKGKEFSETINEMSKISNGNQSFIGEGFDQLYPIILNDNTLELLTGIDVEGIYYGIDFVYDLQDLNTVLLTKGSGGSDIIDDDITSTDKTWSSDYINYQISQKASIQDTTTSSSKTWSSQKIRNEIDSASPTMHTLTINVNDEIYEYDGSSDVTIDLINAEGELF